MIEQKNKHTHLSCFGAAIFDQVNLVQVQVRPSEYSPSETRPSGH